jgi:nitrogenase molybdenum-iron protein alpha/beta subunit
VEIPITEPDPRRVALVGYGWDRGEGEHRANLEELSRLLRALDLEPVTAWFGAGGLRDGLRQLDGVGTVVSLPRGRAAARTLTQRLGATLVETDAPLGLGGTRRWLEAIADSTDRTEAAAALVERELDELVPALERVAALDLLHRRLVYLGEPAYAAGLSELGHDLGFELAAAVFPARPHHRDALRSPDALPATTLWQPTTGEAQRALAAAHAEAPLALVITNTHHLGVARALGLPFLEFGFPDRISHRRAAPPFLGFRGCLCFMELLADRMRLFDALQSDTVFAD